MRSTCAKKEICKKIKRPVLNEHYFRAYDRQRTKRIRQTKKLRQGTVEPVFGSLTQVYGLRKIGVPGKAGAHKVMLMTAIALNLKNTLKKEEESPLLVFLRPL